MTDSAFDLCGGRFIVTKRLGAGGEAIAYFARDTLLDLDVVARLVDNASGNIAARAQFLVLARARSPALVRPFGYFLDNGRALIVEEYVEGETLHAWWPRASPRDRFLALADVAEALAELNEANIEHGDPGNPRNTMVRPDGSVVLIDVDADRFGSIYERGLLERKSDHEAFHDLASDLLRNQVAPPSLAPSLSLRETADVFRFAAATPSMWLNTTSGVAWPNFKERSVAEGGQFLRLARKRHLAVEWLMHSLLKRVEEATTQGIGAGLDFVAGRASTEPRSELVRRLDEWRTKELETAATGLSILHGFFVRVLVELGNRALTINLEAQHSFTRPWPRVYVSGQTALRAEGLPDLLAQAVVSVRGELLSQDIALDLEDDGKAAPQWVAYELRTGSNQRTGRHEIVDDAWLDATFNRLLA